VSAAAPAGAILLTAEYRPFPGGIATFASRLAHEIRDAGFRAHVVAPEYPDLPPAAGHADTHRRLRHHKIPVTALFNVPRLLRSFPSDLPFMAADIRSVLLARVTQPVHRRPYRAMIHGSEVSKLGSGNPVWSLVRHAYAGASMIVANSHATLAEFRAGFGDHPNVVVSHLGVDSAWFDPIEGEFENPELRSLGSELAIACTVGRIEERKGQLEAVRVVARARDTHGLGNVAYAAAGRPEDLNYTEAVRREAARLGVRAVLPGAVSDSDLKRLFQRASCHLLCARQLPGKIEGFGLVILEAAAQSCPTVTSAVGGIPEALGGTGACTAPGDLAAMAAAVAAYGKDRAKRDVDGAAARAHARTCSWNACARRSFPELPWPSTVTR
jgi:phosphatidylinositol alpha-1,6-mannosyltransferase